MIKILTGVAPLGSFFVVLILLHSELVENMVEISNL